MKIIENDTSAVNLHDINYTCNAEYEISHNVVPTKENYSFSTFYKILNRKRNSQEYLAYYEVSNSFKINPIQIDKIEFGNNEEKKLNIQIDRDKMFSENIITQLKRISKLEYNWDSYGASQINWSTIANAIEFFMKIVNNYPDSPLPFISPYPDGSIHVEWQKFSKELHHLIPKDISNYFIYRIINRKETVLKDYYDKAIGIDGMLKIFSIWYSYDQS